MRYLAMILACVCLIGPATGAASAQAYYYEKPSILGRIFGISGIDSVNPYGGGNYSGWIKAQPDAGSSKAAKPHHKHHFWF